jgi:tetratricopeptide (TPR) repeat protein
LRHVIAFQLYLLLFNRASFWKDKGEWARAEADLTQYLSLKTEHAPEHASAYAWRGIVRLRLLRDAEAQADFDRCFKLNPKLRDSLAQLIEAAKHSPSVPR